MGVRQVVPVHSVEWDGSIKDWLNMLMCLFWETQDHHGKATEFWDHDNVIVSVSCRTMLDLFLQAAQIPADSEVLMSAINIGDMQQIIEAHNLKVVPVEVNWKTLGMDIKDLKSKVTDRSRLIIAAHIFGRVNNMDPIIKVGRENNMMVIEDAAEAFAGRKYRGNRESDLVLFSFGQIKFNTTCGGGIGLIKDRILCTKMTDIQNGYPQQATTTFLMKLFVALLFQCSQTRFIARFLVTLVMLGFDYRPFVLGKLRGFPGACDDFLTKFRWKPSLGLMRALDHRLGSFNEEKFSRVEAKKLKYIEKAKNIVIFPGLDADVRCGIWLFPQLTPASITSNMAVALYSSCGIEASLTTCQLGPLKPNSQCPKTTELMSKLLFLPVNSQATKRDLDRILSVTESIYQLDQKLE